MGEPGRSTSTQGRETWAQRPQTRRPGRSTWRRRLETLEQRPGTLEQGPETERGDEPNEPESFAAPGHDRGPAKEPRLPSGPRKVPRRAAGPPRKPGEAPSRRASP